MKSTTHVHFFVVPPDYLNELHDLEKQADDAEAEDRPDLFYRSNQVFVRARQVAVASIIMEEERYHAPASAFWIWMDERFRGGKDRNVVDADEFEVIRRGLSLPQCDDLLLWADVHKRGAGNVDRIYLLEIHDLVVNMLRSVPPGPHGFVYGYFFTDALEPPAPPEPKQWRSLSVEDTEHFKQSMERRGWRSRVRKVFDFWPEEEGSEGRYLLGLLAPERATMLHQAHRAAWQAILDHGHTLGYPRLQEVIAALEHELVHRTILTRADLVHAHDCLNWLAEWDRPREPRAVATPEMAHDLCRRLDALEQEHGGVDGVIEQVWREERYWSRDAIRQAYDQVRDLVRRAMDRGHGFAWLLDRDW